MTPFVLQANKTSAVVIVSKRKEKVVTPKLHVICAKQLLIVLDKDWILTYILWAKHCCALLLSKDFESKLSYRYLHLTIGFRTIVLWCKVDDLTQFSQKYHSYSLYSKPLPMINGDWVRYFCTYLVWNLNLRPTNVKRTVPHCATQPSLSRKLLLRRPKLVNSLNFCQNRCRYLFAKSSSLWFFARGVRFLQMFRTCLWRIDTCYRGRLGPLAVTIAPELKSDCKTARPPSHTELSSRLTDGGYFRFALVLSPL